MPTTKARRQSHPLGPNHLSESVETAEVADHEHKARDADAIDKGLDRDNADLERLVMDL